MSQAAEETNRRMLRARDAMDRSHAEPLEVPAPAKMCALIGYGRCKVASLRRASVRPAGRVALAGGGRRRKR